MQPVAPVTTKPKQDAPSSKNVSEPLGTKLEGIMKGKDAAGNKGLGGDSDKDRGVKFSERPTYVKYTPQAEKQRVLAAYEKPYQEQVGDQHQVGGPSGLTGLDRGRMHSVQQVDLGKSKNVNVVYLKELSNPGAVGSKYVAPKVVQKGQLASATKNMLSDILAYRT